jgi:copper(I)-binding protein
VKRLNAFAGLACAATLFASAAIAQSVTVSAPWVRGTVAGQKATGAFMELTSRSDAKLLSVASPVAGIVEVHEMTMDAGIMRMRAVPRLELPAGTSVKLGPGGYHVMLMDLKRQLKPGDAVPLTLRIERSDGKIETIDVRAEVRDLSAAQIH